MRCQGNPATPAGASDGTRGGSPGGLKHELEGPGGSRRQRAGAVTRGEQLPGDDLEKLLPAAKIRPAVDQVELHPYFQQRDLRPFLQKHGITVEAWYPIDHGSKRLLAEPVAAELAKRYGKSVVQVILRWHVQSQNIAIPKSTSPTHIRQNLDVFDFE